MMSASIQGRVIRIGPKHRQVAPKLRIKMGTPTVNIAKEHSKAPPVATKPEQRELLSSTLIMKCILLSKGPVTTQMTLRNNFRKLRHITKHEFIFAGEQLQKVNLGYLVKLPARGNGGVGRGAVVFVKKKPEEVQTILQGNDSFGCSPYEYTERFMLRVPTVFPLRVRAQLVQMGLTTEKQLT